MKNFNQEDIRNFWESNPVGSQFVTSNLEAKDFFEKYDSYRYTTENHILSELDDLDLQNKKVLEVGIGQASDAVQIIKRGAHYYGIDLTSKSIEIAKLRFDISNLKFKEVSVANASSIPYPNDFFDVIYSHGVIHHSPEIEKIVDEFYRVLKKDGEAIVMLYHRNSINYHISIKIVRRLGLLILKYMPFIVKPIARITGENRDRIQVHLKNLKEEGLSYLKMSNFLHKSTDGPENVYSSVWATREVNELFGKFKSRNVKIHFLNNRQLFGLPQLLPKKMRQILGNKWGWHLWVKARK